MSEKNNHANTGTHHTRTGFEIAVIGLAGRFPGAKNIDEFWENLQNGVEPVWFLGEAELKEAGISSAALENPKFVKVRGGIIEDKEWFDASFFGYSPREAEIMDPQFRLFHECAWTALEHAGCDPFSYDGLIGLYAGAALNLNWHALCIMSGKDNQLGDFAALQLTDKDYLATRISYKLDLKGPAMVTQSLCSTSLLAIHTASRALLMGECDMALAGGVNVNSRDNRGYLYQEGMIHSADGHCRAFDAEARGTIGGNGVGIVVLKRLKHAIAHRDYIHAVILGSAINNDGACKVGFTAPSIDGQVAVIKRAQRVARVEPESIGYIEAHGTGTALGDPVEIEALKQAFNTQKKNYCGIGSVKTNFGHLDSAAGVAGFIKTVLALKHRLIPPNLHFNTPNPKIDIADSPFYVNRELSPWKDNHAPIRAGVSSFGMGGTNAHLILEEAPVIKRQAADENQRHQLFLVSAKTGPALEKTTENLVRYLRENPETNPADAAYTLQVGRSTFKHRRKLVCSTTAEAVEILSGLNPRKVHTFGSDPGKPAVVFMLAGLGSQYVNMGYGLYNNEPLFREEMQRCFEILKPLMGDEIDIKDILYPPDSLSPGEVSQVEAANPGKIHRFEIAQAVIFVLEYALAKLLMKWGITPGAMIGYSFGEYLAACLSGVFTLEDALKLVVIRGKLIQQVDPGEMLSVPLAEKELTALLPEDLSIAIDNGPSCIVSGPTAAIERFEKQMKEKRSMCMRPGNSQALHSKMMEPILKEFQENVGQIPLNTPQIPYISNVSGNWITVEEATSPAYWAKHLRHTVRFAHGIKQLMKEPGTIFVEIGPGRDLSTLMARYSDDNSSHQIINLLRHPQKDVPDIRYLLNKIGDLWLYGVKIDWNRFYPGEKRYRLPLPTYPFERQRYWIEGNPYQMWASAAETGAASLEKRSDMADWFYIPAWEQAPLKTSPPLDPLSPWNWLIFTSEACEVDDRLGKQLQQGGHRVTRVRTGPQFAKLSDEEYCINPRQVEDYSLLFKELCKINRVPDKIYNFWGVTGDNHGECQLVDLDESMDTGLYSLLNMVQAMGRESIARRMQLLVVTDEMQEVMGGETVYPVKAAVIGAVKVIPLEYPNITCRSVDIVIPDSGGTQEKLLVDHLLNEACAHSGEIVVAYRGKYRWAQVIKPHRLEKPAVPARRFEEQGVYLITGGMGGMGFTLAEHLARTFKARLILVGRSPFPAKDQWTDWLNTHDQEDDTSLKIRKVRELEDRGAKIMIASADVSNLEQMRQAVHRATNCFGPVRGVLHTAGVIDYAGVIQRRTREMTEDVMAPKIKGTLVLDTIFKDAPLDFLVLFSSIGNLIYGIKFAQVSYNAANEFLDAFAYYKNSRSNTFTLSINWIDWLKVGMAIKAIDKFHKGNKENIDYESILHDALMPSEGVEVFVRMMEYDLQRIAMSTRDLNRAMAYFNNPAQWENGTREQEEENKPSGTLYQRPELDSQFSPPRNKIEENLIDIFQDFFGIEGLGIYDDFFELGGDSLQVMTVSNKIHKALQVEIPLAEFFSRPTPEKLAQYITRAAKTRYRPIEAVEKKDYYPVSSTQKRLYILQQMNVDSTNYNVPEAIPIDGGADRDQLEENFRKLIRRHEALRTSFHILAGQPVQRIADEVEFKIEYYQLKEEVDPDKAIDSFVRPFHLSRAPLLRVGLIRIPGKGSLVVVDIHHIVADGISVFILVEEFGLLAQGKDVPGLNIQYKDYSEWLNLEKNNSTMGSQEKYWLDVFKGDIPVLKLPLDYPRPEEKSLEGRTLTFMLGKEDANKLRKMAREKEVTLYMLLLAAYIVLLSKLGHQEEIIVDLTTGGRNHADLERVIGTFINTLAAWYHPGGEQTFIGFLHQVKDITLAAFENQDYPFEDLVVKLGVKRDPGRSPITDVAFGLLARNEYMEGKEDVKKIYESKTSKFELCLICTDYQDILFFNLEYCTTLFKQDTIEKFIRYYRRIIAEILENPRKKIKEIRMMSEDEKVKILSSIKEDEEQILIDFDI